MLYLKTLSVCVLPLLLVSQSCGDSGSDPEQEQKKTLDEGLDAPKCGAIGAVCCSDDKEVTGFRCNGENAACDLGGTKDTGGEPLCVSCGGPDELCCGANGDDDRCSAEGVCLAGNGGARCRVGCGHQDQPCCNEKGTKGMPCVPGLGCVPPQVSGKEDFSCWDLQG